MQPLTVDFSATVVDENSSAPVAGAKVCAFMHPELGCAMTDAAGKFTQKLPQKDKAGLTLDKAGYGGVFVPVTTLTFPFSNLTITMATTTNLGNFYTQATTPYPDAGKGFLKVSFVSMGAMQPGSTAALVPAVGKGPLYANATGAYDASLQGTSSIGTVRFGAVPTIASMEVDGSCANGFTVQGFFGWANANMSKIELPIVEGYETQVSFGCSSSG